MCGKEEKKGRGKEEKKRRKGGKKMGTKSQKKKKSMRFLYWRSLSCSQTGLLTTMSQCKEIYGDVEESCFFLTMNLIKSCFVWTVTALLIFERSSSTPNAAGKTKVWWFRTSRVSVHKGSTSKHLSKVSFRCHEPRHEKTCFCHVRTTKLQISLRICAVWSAPLLVTAWIV